MSKGLFSLFAAVALTSLAVLPTSTEAYTDVYCENCWYESHENRWEMEEYKYPDYETAFWTCCFQCWGQDGDWTPGNDASPNPPAIMPRVVTHSTNPHPLDDPANDPRAQRIPQFRRARGVYTYPPGQMRNNIGGTAPTYEADPLRQCPAEYQRNFYPSTTTTRPAVRTYQPTYSSYQPNYSYGTTNTYRTTNNYTPATSYYSPSYSSGAYRSYSTPTYSTSWNGSGRRY